MSEDGADVDDGPATFSRVVLSEKAFELNLCEEVASDSPRMVLVETLIDRDEAAG